MLALNETLREPVVFTMLFIILPLLVGYSASQLFLLYFKE